MNRTMQDNSEMRDEEIYALLDKALDTKRLCVSEELIQKTLKRVAAEEEGAKVISFEKAAKRKLSPMKYVGVAAAAVLVAFLGVRTLGNGGFSKETAPMEATNGNAANKTEAMLADCVDGRGFLVMDNKSKSSEHFYSISDSDDALNSMATEEAVTDMELPKEETEGLTSMRCATVSVSERLAEAMDAAGKMLVSRDAECWEFVSREENWENALFEGLAAGVAFSDELSEAGDYSYMLVRKDGSVKHIKFGQPLDLIVRLETEKGTLWCLFGGEVFFRTE